MDAALRGGPVTIHGDGNQTRDFTYVDSVTDVLLLAATGCVTSETPVNLAFGSRRTLLDVVAELEGVLGRPYRSASRRSTRRRCSRLAGRQPRLLYLFPEAVAIPFEAGLLRTTQWMAATTSRLSGG